MAMIPQDPYLFEGTVRYEVYKYGFMYQLSLQDTFMTEKLFIL